MLIIQIYKRIIQQNKRLLLNRLVFWHLNGKDTT